MLIFLLLKSITGFCMHERWLFAWKLSKEKKKNIQQKSVLDNDQLVKKICRTWGSVIVFWSPFSSSSSYLYLAEKGESRYAHEHWSALQNHSLSLSLTRSRSLFLSLGIFPARRSIAIRVWSLQTLNHRTGTNPKP